MRAKLVIAAKLALIGAVAFWGPDTLIHAIRGLSFGALDLLVITVVSPIVLFLALFRCAKAFQVEASAVAARMLLGVWLLGGIFMMIGASFFGGGFTSPGGIRETLYVISLSLLPIYTFMMATYDGSLGALILTTLGLLAIWLAGKRKRNLAWHG